MKSITGEYPPNMQAVWVRARMVAKRKVEKLSFSFIRLQKIDLDIFCRIHILLTFLSALLYFRSSPKKFQVTRNKKYGGCY